MPSNPIAVNRLNQFIPRKYDDKVFFYANRLEFSPTTGWDIFIDPDACLTGFADVDCPYPTVDQLRAERYQWQALPHGGFSLRGKLLFSGGVILFIDEKILLFRRDRKAPVSPLRWTCPAGRADRHPYLTALKEMNEEIILYDELSQRPVFLDVPDQTFQDDVESVFSSTVGYKGFSTSHDNWIRTPASYCPERVNYGWPVNTWFGDVTADFPGSEKLQYFTFFNKRTSTLEIMLPLAFSTDILPSMDLKCMDGEYSRPVNLFSAEEFKAMTNEDLVATMAHLKNTHLDFKKSTQLEADSGTLEYFVLQLTGSANL